MVRLKTTKINNKPYSLTIALKQLAPCFVLVLSVPETLTQVGFEYKYNQIKKIKFFYVLCYFYMELIALSNALENSVCLRGQHPMTSISALNQGSQFHPQNRPAKQLAFGKLFKNGAQYGGLFVNPEPVSHGGLGKVGQELPAVFEKEMGVPLLSVFPVLKPLVKELAQGQKLATLTLKDWQGKNRQFDIVELPKTKDGVRRIGVANPELFGTNDTLYSNIYLPAENLKEGTKDAKNYIEDGGFKAYAMFNKAVAEFLNKHQNKLKQPLKFVVANDWMASSFLSQLDDKQKVGLKKLFFFHNQYDQPRSLKLMQQLGFKLPEAMQGKKYVSSIGLGIEEADGVIINRNYFDHLTQTALAKGQGYLDKLKALKDKVVDMHHGILEAENPRTASAFAKDGFVQLAANADVEAIQKFKATNKAALQKKLSLKQDPNAVVMAWMARFDPQQKGFGMVAESMKGLLDKHPNLQMVICGMDASPKIKEALEAVTSNKVYKDRVYYSTNKIVNDERLQILGSSDFLMMPSLYEPFGLGQLEAMKMGTIPLVNDVDGLKSTTSDPTKNEGDKETAWGYGQNAIKMKRFESAAYMRGYNKANNPQELSEHDEAIIKVAQETKDDPSKAAQFLSSLAKEVVEAKVLTPEDEKAVLQGNRAFQQAVDDALKLAKDEKAFNTVRKNAINYVDKEHTWLAISERFYQPLLKKLFPDIS